MEKSENQKSYKMKVISLSKKTSKTFSRAQNIKNDQKYHKINSKKQICRNSGYLATSCQAGPNIFHSSRQFLPRFTHKMSRNSHFSCFEVIYINEFGLPVDFYFIKIQSAGRFYG